MTTRWFGLYNFPIFMNFRPDWRGITHLYTYVLILDSCSLFFKGDDLNIIGNINHHCVNIPYGYYTSNHELGLIIEGQAGGSPLNRPAISWGNVAPLDSHEPFVGENPDVQERTLPSTGPKKQTNGS